MALTTSVIFGQYDGQSLTGSNSAWNGCNFTSPNIQPAIDLLQVWTVSGKILLQCTGNGVVNVGTSITNVTNGTLIASLAISQAAFNTLPANPTAQQIMTVALPQNVAQKSDLVQIISAIAEPGTPGGGKIIWRLLWNASTATS